MNILLILIVSAACLLSIWLLAVALTAPVEHLFGFAND
jgi:hypothetical protein